MENEILKIATQFGFGAGLAFMLFLLFKWLLQNVIKNYQVSLDRANDLLENHISLLQKATEEHDKINGQAHEKVLSAMTTLTEAIKPLLGKL